MTNRNLIIRKLENLEGKMKSLKNFVNTNQPLKSYISSLNDSEELIEELKSIIEREPRTPGEINHLG